MDSRKPNVEGAYGTQDAQCAFRERQTMCCSRGHLRTAVELGEKSLEGLKCLTKEFGCHLGKYEEQYKLKIF